MTQLEYSAANRDDLERLAARLRLLGPNRRAKFLGLMFGGGHMRSPGIASAVVVGVLTIIMWLRGFSPARQWAWFFVMNVLSDKNPSIVNEAFETTVSHLLSGRDLEDKTSVGGFSQREINLITKFI